MMARCKLNPCCGETLPGRCVPPPQIRPGEGWDAYKRRTATPAPSQQPAGEAGGLVERARVAVEWSTQQLAIGSWRPTRSRIEGLRNLIRDLMAKIEADAPRLAALEAENAGLRNAFDRRGGKIIDLSERATRAEAESAALTTEVDRLTKIVASCQWHWPEDDTSEDCCCGSAQEVVDAVYGWSAKTGEVVSVARGGIVEVTHCVSLPPAPDADSDDDFWVEEMTREAAQQKVDEELRRRATLTGGDDV